MRATALAKSDAVADVQTALHLGDFVIFDGGELTKQAREKKAEALHRRSQFEESYVAQNILEFAATLERRNI